MRRLEAQAVVFDLDGVLVDSERTNVSSARDALRSRGLELADDEVSLVVGRHPIDYMPELARRRGLHEGVARALLETQYALYHQLAEDETMTPGALESLEALERAGKRLALATSSDRTRVEERLAHYGVLARFEFLLAREDVSERKPSPQIYERAIERLSLDPSAILVVEDSPHGIHAAKGAGLRCIALRTPWVSDEARQEADLVIETLGELCEVVG